MSKEFGQLLKKYRAKTTDPMRGNPLTQERFAELLDEMANLPGFYNVTISNWESGKHPIKPHDRQLLTGLIHVLSECGGIKSLAEAQKLLFAGDYRNLDDAEIQAISPEWHKNKGVQRPDSSETTPLSPYSFHAVHQWLDNFFEWTNADDHMHASWRGMVIHSINSLQKKLSYAFLLRLLLWFLLWLITTILVTPLFQWPLDNPLLRRQAAFGYAINSLIIPPGIALLTTADREDSFALSTSRQQVTLFILKLSGAYVGFNGFMPILFLGVFIAHSLAEFTLSALLISFWVVLPIVWGHVGAGRIPTDRHKMVTDDLKFYPGDKLFLLVFVMIGSMIAAALHFLYEPFFAYRSVGVVLILLLIGILIWHRWQSDPTFMKAWQLIVLLGAVMPTTILSLFIVEIYGNPFDWNREEWGATLLVMGGFAILSCLLVTLRLRRQKPLPEDSLNRP